MQTPVGSAPREGFVGPAWSGMRPLIRNPGVEIAVAMATIAIARIEIIAIPLKKRTGPQPAAAGTPVRSRHSASIRARSRGPKPPGLTGLKPDSVDYLRIVIDFVSLPSHADWIMT